MTCSQYTIYCFGGCGRRFQFKLPGRLSIAQAEDLIGMVRVRNPGENPYPRTCTVCQACSIDVPLERVVDTYAEMRK